MDPIRRTNQRLDHVNRVLKGIRRVNHLIVQANDQDALLQGTCDCLTETHGYFNAWIATFDKDQKVFKGRESGLGTAFSPVIKQLKKGIPTRCLRDILNGKSVFLIKDPSTVCADCPLAPAKRTCGALALQLSCGEHVYGGMVVSIPQASLEDQEEIDLLTDLSRDLGFALNNLKIRADLHMHRHITRGLPHPMAVIDKDYRFCAVNEAYFDLCGKQPAEIIGKSMEDICGAELFTEKIKPYIDRCLAGESVTFEVEINFPRAGTKWMSMVYVPYIDETGSTKGILSHGTDISEKKEIQKSLLESEKMEAVSQLAAGIAHDLNNQLTSVIGYGDMLVDQLDNPTLRGYAKKICSAAWRSAELTQNLLTFARQGQYLCVPVDIHTAIHDIVAMLKCSVDKRIHIQEDLKASETTIRGDPSHIKHALLNLAFNARDAMGGGGTLTFATEVAEVKKNQGPTRDSDISDGRYIVISIADTGHGIPKKVLPHIFEPFYTTKNQGRGMGLASAYGTIMHYRGHIAVSSVTGKGTRFSIYLPLDTPSPKAESKPQKSPERAKHLTILVVDDEKNIRYLGREILTAEGHAVLTAADGPEAIDLYRRQWKTIDVIILDVIMPEMSGLDALRYIKQINPRARAILASGFRLDENSSAIRNSGALRFIQKPFNKSQLLEAIQQASSDSSYHQQREPDNL